ncbi:MAG: dynamin family protein, partial [Chitinophagaceae bacterium]
MDNVNTYFSGLEVFKKLRFEIVKALESSGRDADTFKKEYDNFSNAQGELISNHMKISTGSLPLKIGIVGSFSTGKSLLINSLIGSELLGIADIASTCKVTILSYRDVASPQIYKIAEDNQPTKVTYEEYLKFSMHDKDKTDNLPGEKIHFEIYHPATVLKDFQIIDTPGFSSLSKGDDEITKEYLKKADVLLWVFDGTRGAIDEKEKKILQGILNKRIIGVVNRIDMLPPGQRPRVLQSYTEGYEFFKITPYSALSSLKYQKNVQFNNQVYEKIKAKLAEFMPVNGSLNIQRQQNNLFITSNSSTLFECELKETEEDDEEIQYHFSLMNILKEMRYEISLIK